jgi:hypothetical protein
MAKATMVRVELLLSVATVTVNLEQVAVLVRLALSVIPTKVGMVVITVPVLVVMQVQLMRSVLLPVLVLFV